MRDIKFTMAVGTIALSAVAGVVCADKSTTLSAQADHRSSWWAAYRPKSDRNPTGTSMPCRSHQLSRY